MNKILNKEVVAADLVKLTVEAPYVAKATRAGHFVIVRSGEMGERIPLTITASDAKTGTIELTIKALGATSSKICQLNAGDCLTDVVGPLGQAYRVKNYGTALCVADEIGEIALVPIKKALEEAGNTVIEVQPNKVAEALATQKVDYCFTVGSTATMKAVANLTKEKEIPTDCALNVMMIDGTGMCGACRAIVGGKMRFTCVEGPIFDAHQVEF